MKRFENARIGERVRCNYRELSGTITYIRDKNYTGYPIIVILEDGAESSYTLDGKYNTDDDEPCLVYENATIPGDFLRRGTKVTTSCNGEDVEAIFVEYIHESPLPYIVILLPLGQVIAVKEIGEQQ